MKILFLILTFSSLLFSKYIYFNSSSISLQELTTIVSDELNTPILLSSSLSNNQVYLMVNKQIKTSDLLNYYIALLNANGYKLNQKKNFYIVNKYSDTQYFSYFFRNRTSADFKPFYPGVKKFCYLGKNILVCNAVPDKIKFVKKLVRSFDVSLPYDKFKNKTVSIHLKVLESNYNDLLNLSNKFTSNLDTNNLQNSVNSDDGSLSVSSLLLLNGTSIINNLSLNFLFNYLKKKDISRVLSEPNVLVTNDNETTIISGTNRKVIASVTTSQNIENQNTTTYKDFLSGITLKVAVHIINKNSVRVKLFFSNENVVGGTALLPVSTKQNYQTVLIVNKDSSIVIGGILFDKISKVNSSVPILGDIPILGFPFRSKENVKEKHVLSLILTVKDFI